MSCYVCSIDILPEHKLSELPCCGLKIHSQCFINICTHAAYYFQSLNCPCSNTLWYPNQHVVPGQMNQQFIEEARPIKKMVTEYNKIRKSLSQVINQEYILYRAAVTPIINQLKEIRKSSIRNITQSDICKQSRKYARLLYTRINPLQQKYSLRYYQTNEYFKIKWHRSPLTMIRRKFEIRLI